MLKKFVVTLDWWIKLIFLAIFIMDIGLFLPWYSSKDIPNYYPNFVENYHYSARTGFDTGLSSVLIIASFIAIAGCLAEKAIKKPVLLKIIAQIIQITGGLWQLLYVYMGVLDFDDYGAQELLPGFWIMLLGYSVWFGAVLLRFLMNFRLANFDRPPAENITYFNKNS